MNTSFTYQQGMLCADAVPLQLIAERFNTPCFVYAKKHLIQKWLEFDQAFQGHPHTICYAVKANSNLAVLEVLANLGSGFDIVSQGELARVLVAGGDPKKVVFSGVGKRESEIAFALEKGIGAIHIESLQELYLIQRVAKQKNRVAVIAVRVNPDIDPKTHPYIATGLRDSKFGIPLEQALEVYQEASRLSHVQAKGIACHIGSQIAEVSPFVDALTRLIEFTEKLLKSGLSIDTIDMGGGFGIRYTQEDPMPNSPKVVLDALLGPIKSLEKKYNCEFKLMVEPGRYIAASSGVLLTKIDYIKQQGKSHYLIVDAGMNDFIRPALYQANHRIIPIVKQSLCLDKPNYQVVGPVCETGDFLGVCPSFEAKVGDYLALHEAGAYGFVMSSNYNTRPRAAEVMVDGDQAHLIRPRETTQSLYASEAQCLAAMKKVDLPVSKRKAQVIPFTKMHGLGNDFIVINTSNYDHHEFPSEWIIKIADRHRGVGFDQLLLVSKMTSQKDSLYPSFQYTIYNADGSQAKQCGNGARCVGRFLKDQGLLKVDKALLQLANKKQIMLTLGKNNQVTVDMGVPVIKPQLLNDMEVVDIGNLHAIKLVKHLDLVDVETEGKAMQQCREIFPDGVNVSFMEIKHRHLIKLRVYERGAGETHACGSGACASVFVAKNKGLIDDHVVVNLKGGHLIIDYAGGSKPIFMTGEAVSVFEGSIALP